LAAFSAWGKSIFPFRGHGLHDRTLGAYQLDLTEEELKAAPSFTAGEEFDWGDRSREIEIHNYYRVPPYWGAY
jgi:hypothetical protein